MSVQDDVGPVIFAGRMLARCRRRWGRLRFTERVDLLQLVALVEGRGTSLAPSAIFASLASSDGLLLRAARGDVRAQGAQHLGLHI